MGTKHGNFLAVTVETMVKGPPPTDYVILEIFIENGAGEIVGEAFAGDVTRLVTLTHGQQQRAMTIGEAVTVRGTVDNKTVQYPMYVTSNERPWAFSTAKPK
jgi:hypothetical protein